MNILTVGKTKGEQNKKEARFTVGYGFNRTVLLFPIFIPISFGLSLIYFVFFIII